MGESNRRWREFMAADRRHGLRWSLAWWGWVGVAVVCATGGDLNTNNLRRVEFREPRQTVYYVEPGVAKATLAAATNAWTRAWPADGSTNYVALGSRLVLKVRPGTDIPGLIDGRPLTLARPISSDLVILQAASSDAAIAEASALAQRPGVVASYPVMRRAARRLGRYAPRPDDPYFPQQWHLENRDTNGGPLGVDLNARSAWSATRGEGVVVAAADDGIDLSHPDLATNGVGQPHFSFDTYIADGTPQSSDANHGTAVAGLIGAVGDNGIGVSGVAPRVGLASWVIWGAPLFGQSQIVSDEGLMDMFQYASNVVSVQNHSWGNASGSMLGIDALSEQGISNAITAGRGGKGVVIVRAGGNDRGLNNQDPIGNANDDGYGSDPRVIAVAAARYDGLFCSYSSPGASLLVAAPSGDPNPDTGLEDPAAPNIVTTDRQGGAGYHASGAGDSANYCFGDTGFDGTSASTPQISGVAALILATNPGLGYRDVQQILLQSARFYHRTDPDLHTNGAGFELSHNLGFGVPDAGFAVALARHWSNRPPATQLAYPASTTPAIPTNALRVVCGGPGLADALTSIPCWPCQGLHPDGSTAVLPFVYVGQANSDLTQDLHGKAALIQRGTSLFADKIARAAKAGAAFAVIFNNTNTDRVFMMGTAYAPIPAVFINRANGEALRDYVQGQANNTAQIHYEPATISLNVTQAVICEHVGVRLTTTAQARGDLRVGLVSPAGTRSVLQAVSTDASPAPADWIYWSVQHYYESSVGTWRVELSNEMSTSAASVFDAELLIQGVPIVDSDHDGLDDNWEMARLGTLGYGPADDPDDDGYSNAREQCLDTDPRVADPVWGADLSRWDERRVRVAFPAAANRTYQIRAASGLNQAATILTNVAGRLPEVEIVVPYLELTNQFFNAVRTP